MPNSIVMAAIYGQLEHTDRELRELHITIKNQIKAAEKQTDETQKLNTRIYWLTCATTFLAAIQAYPIIKDLLKQL